MQEDERQKERAARGKSHPWYGAMEFRTLAESIPALVFVSDSAGANIYSNAQFQRYTGLSADEMLGDGWLQAIHPGDRGRAEETWLESWRDKKPYDTRYRFRKFDGEYRWHLVRGEPVEDANDNIVRWIGSCTDIEDLIAGLAVRSQAEEILHALQKSPDIMLYARNADGEFIYANEALGKAMGEAKTEIIGSNADKLAAVDDKGVSIEAADAVVRDTGQSITTTENWRLPTGRSLSFQSTTVPLPLPDGTTGVAVVSTDVTRVAGVQNRYDETLAHLKNRLDAIPHIIWEADEQGNITGANQAWYDHAGSARGLGERFEDVLPEASADRFLQLWDSCKRSGEILDMQVEVRDEIGGEPVSRRALAIPIDRAIDGRVFRVWYGSFS